jgi:hypothetical protein
MFYSIGKRHTGGWCGPGQRTSPSVMCQSIPQLARSADGFPAVLAPAPAPVDQGPGVEPVTSYYLLVTRPTCFEVDPTGATPAQIVAFFDSRPVFQLPGAPAAKASFLLLESGEGRGWGMDEGETAASRPPAKPTASPTTGGKHGRPEQGLGVLACLIHSPDRCRALLAKQVPNSACSARGD